MSTERLSHASSTFARPVERHGNAFSVKHMPVGTTVWNMRPTVAIVQMDHDFGVARQSINPSPALSTSAYAGDVYMGLLATAAVADMPVGAPPPFAPALEQAPDGT